MAALRLLELTNGSDGGMNTAISQEEGAAEVTYRLSGANEDLPPSPYDIADAFDFFLGGVTNLATKTVSEGTKGAGLVVRKLPPVHPFRPELSCAGVVSMVGAGRHIKENAQRVDGLTPVTEQWPLYTNYDFRVKFTKRPYFLLPDEKVARRKDLLYWPPDGTSGIPIVYCEEWTRFTSTTRTPTGETVNASSGQMTFRTATGGATAPNGSPYPGQPFMSLENELIEMMWYLVPYRYFQEYETHKPYLTRFVNRVNQHDWNGHPAGTLLYLGATPTSFIPATPDQKKYLAGLAAGLEQNLLCNIKLRFLKTARTGTDVPGPDHPLLTNKNFIAAGHNLLPNYADRKFYYCVGEGGADADRRPIFESFPFALLFTDPMLMQQGGAL